MSRYTYKFTTTGGDKATLACGWDAPLREFFAQIFDHEDECVFDVSGSTVEEVEEKLLRADWVAIPSQLYINMRQDQVARPVAHKAPNLEKLDEILREMKKNNSYEKLS